MKNKIYTTINEWKESDNYLISKWFDDKKKYLTKLFEENELLQDLEFDYFEFDAGRYAELYVGQLFFNEEEYQYKLTILIDYAQIEENGDIELVNIKFDAYDPETNELIGTINREDLEDNLFNENYILELIDDFKTEYTEDKKDIEDL